MLLKLVVFRHVSFELFKVNIKLYVIEIHQKLVVNVEKLRVNIKLYVIEILK